MTEAEREELLTKEPALALASLLDVPAPDLEVPLLWHWLHLLERPAEADLGPDGHPVRSPVLEPPGPGRRRMWAAGTVTTHRPLLYGLPATRRTRVTSTIDKQGRTGPLTFVTLRHEIHQAGHLAVEEAQDIVYREAVMPTGSPALPAPGDETEVAGDWRVRTTPTLLFRFSALTYNAHRIHYDRDYAREVEGYPGLVVHGPLQALLMAEAVRAGRQAAFSPATFGYRLLAPVFDEEGLLVATRPDGTGVATRARSGTGRPSAAGHWEPR